VHLKIGTLVSRKTAQDVGRVLETWAVAQHTYALANKMVCHGLLNVTIQKQTSKTNYPGDA